MTATNTQFHHFEQTLTREVSMEYALTLPAGYDEQGEKNWPLLLTLHGSVGPDAKLAEISIDQDIAPLREVWPEFPFVVLSPRCPGHGWDPVGVHALLDEIEERYRIDTDRIYVTGFSMGGGGTWRMAYSDPGRFAALVPLAGWGTPFEARRIAHIPVWIFHGEKDDAVPVHEAEAMAEALRRYDGDVTLTIYPDAGHPILRQTYTNHELYEWLLQQKRKPLKFKRG